MMAVAGRAARMRKTTGSMMVAAGRVGRIGKTVIGRMRKTAGRMHTPAPLRLLDPAVVQNL